MCSGLAAGKTASPDQNRKSSKFKLLLDPTLESSYPQASNRDEGVVMVLAKKGKWARLMLGLNGS